MRKDLTHKKSCLKTTVLVLFTASVLVLHACAGAPEEPAAPAEEPAEEPAEPEEPEPPVPPEPDQPPGPYPVQYGPDSRTELLQHSDPNLQRMADSVGIFVREDQLETYGDRVKIRGYTLDETSQIGLLVEGAGLPMCSGELFATQPAPGYCTGFLVDEDLLVTAVHCLESVPCAETIILFGFHMRSEDTLAEITPGHIYRCKEIIAESAPTQDNHYLDFALVKLDRSTGRPGLAYATEDQLAPQKGVAAIGHPSGLPMKIASDAMVLQNEGDQAYFVANLDTFGSNSGSPVIDTEKYQVAGILVRGMDDYVLSEDGSCVRVNRCPEDGGTACTGEYATKMSWVSEYLPGKAEHDSNDGFCFPDLRFIPPSWRRCE